MQNQIQIFRAPSKRKDVNIKVFNMTTSRKEENSNSTTYNSNQKWNNKSCQCECKNYRKCKKYYCGILAHVFVKIVSI